MSLPRLDRSYVISLNAAVCCTGVYSVSKFSLLTATIVDDFSYFAEIVSIAMVIERSKVGVLSVP